jgi:cytoskeleton protein RodZ
LDDRAPRPRVGRLLRRQREEYNQDLRSVAEATRIRYAYLHAIEEGRFGDLPGLTYAVGFVRTYADYLGLDEEEIVTRFKEEVEGLDRRTNLEFPVPVSEGKVPSGAIIALAVILIAVAYGGWYYLSERGQTLTDLVPEVPDRLQGLLGEQEQVQEQEQAQPADKESVASESTEAAQENLPPVEEAPATEAAPSAETAEEAPAAEGLAEEDASEAPQATMSESSTDMSDAAETLSRAPEALPERTSEIAAETAAETEATAETSMTEIEPEAPTAADSIPEEPETTASGTASEPSTEAAAPEPVPETAEAASSEADGTATAEAEGESIAPAIPSAPDSSQQAEIDRESATGRIFGAGNADARIVLEATDDSWVQVRDPEGQLLLTRVLRKGDVYRVPNREGLTLLTGNAGGLSVTVDGQSAPALGQSGEVVRDVPLNPDRLSSGTAVAQ